MTRCRAPRTRFSGPSYSAAAMSGAEWPRDVPGYRQGARAARGAQKDRRVPRRRGRLAHAAPGAGPLPSRCSRDRRSLLPRQAALVEDFSAEMFSHGESRAPLLKQRILDALDLFASRLYSLETRRRAGTPYRLLVQSGGCRDGAEEGIRSRSKPPQHALEALFSGVDIDFCCAASIG